MSDDGPASAPHREVPQRVWDSPATTTEQAPDPNRQLSRSQGARANVSCAVTHQGNANANPGDVPLASLQDAGPPRAHGGSRPSAGENGGESEPPTQRRACVRNTATGDTGWVSLARSNVGPCPCRPRGPVTCVTHRPARGFYGPAVDSNACGRGLAHGRAKRGLST